MSIFNGLMGNASEVNLEALQKDVQKLLVEGESIQSAYKVIRDTFIFTNRRLILVDKQGVTGKKTEYLSIPYKSIVHFSVETAGTFDLDAELKIWISGNATPLQKNFNKSTNIYDVQRVLAKYVIG
ncbi:MAG: PH domain-containing protein [Solibacillus sp.]|uniref:PH domain-containing protein n=1 Tax=unclassified Solibacillus TaxID=2637870 RepID=UPI0030FB648F